MLVELVLIGFRGMEPHPALASVLQTAIAIP
jgi:hypothetical protein